MKNRMSIRHIRARFLRVIAGLLLIMTMPGIRLMTIVYAQNPTPTPPPDGTVGYTQGPVTLDQATQKYYEDIQAFDPIGALTSNSTRLWLTDSSASVVSSIALLACNSVIPFIEADCGAQQGEIWLRCVNCMVSKYNNCKNLAEAKAKAVDADFYALLLTCVGTTAVSPGLAVLCIIVSTYGSIQKIKVIAEERRQCWCGILAACNSEVAPFDCTPYKLAQLKAISCP